MGVNEAAVSRGADAVASVVGAPGVPPREWCEAVATAVLRAASIDEPESEVARLRKALSKIASDQAPLDQNDMQIARDALTGKENPSP